MEDRKIINDNQFLCLSLSHRNIYNIAITIGRETDNKGIGLKEEITPVIGSAALEVTTLATTSSPNESSTGQI